MNINDKYKVIFIHLAKNAGISVKKALGYKNNDLTNTESGLKQSVVLGFDVAYWNNKIYPEKWKDYNKFTIVRNPWSRVVSNYCFRKKENDLYKQFPQILGANAMGGDKLGPDGEEWSFKRWLFSGYKIGNIFDEDLRIMEGNFVDSMESLPKENKKHISDDRIKEFMDKDSKTLEEAIENHSWFIPNLIYPSRITKYSDMFKRTEKPVKVVTPDGVEEIYDYPLLAGRERSEWWNQVDLISCPFTAELYVDNILRFEHLEDDWNEMFKNYGYEAQEYF